MRTIKFRVWAIKAKCWLHTENMSFVQDSETGTFYPFGISPQAIVVQQFTGLLDKNGKEIYEGDILQYKSDYNESQGGQIGPDIFKVEFLEGCFHFGNDTASKDSAEIFEVIGNIFDNPELL